MTYSGFLRRFGAAIIDGLVLWVPSLIFGGASASIFGSLGVSFLLGLIYYPIFESSKLSATPGKAILGMVVLSESGEPLTIKAAAIRFFCRYISIATCYIGYIMQIFTTKRQTLHDMLSESVVIDRKSPDLNYFRIWVDQFKTVVNKL
jgi:uncharacterized RDD family membrane protein YckC